MATVVVEERRAVPTLVETLPAADPAPLGLAAFALTTFLPNALAWFFFAFAIFNTYMLLWSTRVSGAVFGVFLTLEVTEIVLCIAYFNLSHGGSTWLLHAGGWCGVVTAAVAWYTSAAGVVNGMAQRVVLPVGA